MNDLNLSRAVLASFDNSGADAPAEPEKMLSQSEVNRILAEDRRKHMRMVEEARQALDARNVEFEQVQKDKEEALAKMEELQSASLSPDQRLAAERKKIEECFGKEIAVQRKAASEWETRYRESLVDQALQDAATNHSAYDAQVLAAVLKPMLKVEKNDKGDYMPIIEFPDTDTNTGESVVVAHTPDSATRRMKELPRFQHLFKSGVVSGAGSHSGGPTPGNNGRIDPRKIQSMEQYMKIREENPELLGLRRKDKRTSRLSN